MKFTIDTDAIELIKNEAGQITVSHDTEIKIVEIYQVQKLLESAIEEMKQNIETALLDLDPNIKTIKTDHLTISRRSYGAKYFKDKTIEWDNVPSRIVKTEIKNSLVSKEVDAFIEEKGALPYGVLEANREPKLSIKVKEAE